MDAKDYFDSCKRYFLEITGPPYPGHVGKCLCAPVGTNWKKLEELAPGDCIIHYITSRAKGFKNPYNYCFIGISKVAREPIKISKKELISRLKELNIWNEKYEKFSKKWLNHDYFYFVELKDYREFPIKVRLGVFSSIHPPEKYILEINENLAKSILSYAWLEERKILYVLFSNMIAFEKQKLTRNDSENLEKLRNIIYSISNEFKKDNPDKEELAKLINSLKELGKSIQWLWIIYSTPKKEFKISTIIDKFLLSPEYQDFFKKISQIRSHSELSKLHKDIKEAFLKHPRDLRFVVFTSWLFIVNPKYFAPISGELLWDRIKSKEVKRFQDILWGVFTIGGENARDWFWKYFHETSKKSINEVFEKYFTYNDVLYNIAKDNNLGDMIEVVYLIGKCVRDEKCLSTTLKNFEKQMLPALEENSLNSYSKICNEIRPDLEKIESILYRKGQIILYGPPGVGKTYLANNYTKCVKNIFSENVTFHQSYSYEEFVEGFRPVNDKDKRITRYEVVDGIFKKISIKAMWELFRIICQDNDLCRNIVEYTNNSIQQINDNSYEEIKGHVLSILEKLRNNNILREKLYELYKEKRSLIPKYVLIIDEINRGDISRIFGELITLLEIDKRLLMENQVIVKLPYSGEYFAVPPNLYIIGTMNSTDRSIALVDFALRRRFAFVEIEPNPDKLKDKNIDGLNLADLLRILNDRITEKLDRDHRIGHSYFLEIDNKIDLWRVWFYEVVPLLVEYFYGRLHVLKEVLRGAEDDLLNCSSNDVCYPKNPSKVSEDKLIEALRKIISSGQ